ncbi:MAG: BolA/IbaG family iron-sulfur metabolism protein [Bdellovibrionales bacterium]|nr:BolA/IbaG family iron-sulfur metabolism protein [Bdellovibrionales bacterium]
MTTIEMEKRLKQKYPQCQVVVFDLTGTNDHFEIRINEPSFAEITRIQQHKNIMDVFAEELASGEVHALAIKTLKI